MITITRTIGLATAAVLTIGGPAVIAQRGAQGRGPLNDTAVSAQMSGTYELDATRSGDPQRAARTATNAVPAAQRNRAYQNLLTRLDPPQTLSIERRGPSVTISTSRGAGAAFDADGRVQNERGQDGQMVSTRAEIVGNQLRVSTTGRNRDSNVSLTFDSISNGEGLRVTRRLDDNTLRAPVTLQSYYQRTSASPRWDVYGPGRGPGRGNNNRGARAAGGYGTAGTVLNVPEGTRIITTLDTPISMRNAQTGDPFTLTVSSPAELRGARIDGVLSRLNANRQSQSGRDLRLDFRAIELQGRSADFAGELESLRLPDGTVLRSDSEGSLPDSSNGNGTTVRNGAIGAVIGAIIGAVAGGGKDAAIGAVVGGVGGVVGGMILSQGHEQLDMPRGTDVTITSLLR